MISGSEKFDTTLPHSEKLADYKCNQCSRIGGVISQTSIVKYPKLLTIIFKIKDKRSQADLTCLTDNMSFPGYNLETYISHEGSTMSSGHYITKEIVNGLTYVYDD